MIQCHNKWENSYNMLLGQVVIHDSPLLPEAGEGKSVFFRFNLLTSSVTKKTISCQRKENFSPSFNDSHSCKGSTASTLALMKKNWQTLFLVTKHWQTLFLVTKHWQTLANIDKQTLVNKQLSSKK